MTAMREAFRAAKLVAPVYCPYCGNHAELVDGKSLYPHRSDLYRRKFWRCAPCNAYVGCHRPNHALGFDGTEPLGRLADAQLRSAKNRAHAAFDPLWQSGGMTRQGAYAWLAGLLNVAPDDCHIGAFDVATCNRVVRLCWQRRLNLGAGRQWTQKKGKIMITKTHTAAHLESFAMLMEEAANVMRALPADVAESLAVRHFLCDELDGSVLMAREDAAALRAQTIRPRTNAAVEAIKFALQDEEGLAFLRQWLHGNYGAIRRDWPEAPDTVFIGADPLYASLAN